jgi:hypothetical protein
MIRRVSIAIALIVTAAGQSAYAQGSDAQVREEARLRFQEGRAFLDQGKMEEARIKLLQSYALFPGANVLFNLMGLEEHAGRYAEGMKYARMYRKHPKRDPEGMRDLENHYWPAMNAKTVHVKVSAPAGEQVLVDGASIGKAPLEEVVDVMPGKHVFESGGKRVEVEGQAGQDKEVTFTRAEAKVAPVSVGTTPGGPTLGARYERSAAGYAIPIAVGGVGVVGLVLGGVFAAGSQSSKTELEAKIQSGDCRGLSSASCVPAKERVDANHTQDTLSKVMYISGGALLAAGAVLFFVLPKTEVKETRGVHWSPWLGGNTQGMALEGSF